MLGLQTLLQSSLERNLFQESFLLEDAIERLFPVHMQFVNSWEAFHADLEIRFRNVPGYRKVQNKKYTFQEHNTKKEIPRTGPWDASFLPWQKIDMGLIFNVREGMKKEATCPARHTPSHEEEGTNVQWYV